MPTTNALTVEVLGRITLLQSMVTLMPEPRSMLTFVCQGLKDVSGVRDATYSLPHHSGPVDDRGSPQVTLAVKCKSVTFALLHFYLDDVPAFLPYLPFLKNFANMLGVIFEAARHRALNETLMAELEQRVTARTRELHDKSEELRRSEEQYREIVEGTSDIITTVNARGELTYVNRRAEEIFGYPAHECRGRAFMDFVEPDDRANTANWWSRCLDGRVERASIENRQVNPSTGGLFHLLWTCAFHYDDTGQLLYVNSIGHDYSDRIRAQEDAAKYEAQAQQSQKLESLGVLAGGIAHDFNNLMGGIYACIDMALDMSPSAEAEPFLHKAMSSIDRARGLTQQLLTFARGGAPVQQVGHLFPLLEQVARFALSGSNVSCQFLVPSDLRTCSFDKNQLSQVIENLVINAKQAMPNGGAMTLSARKVTLDHERAGLLPGQYVQLTLQDSGAGISPEVLPRIFEPFFTTKPQGHGLGLATCYSIVKRHGGCIEVESTLSKGSTFHIFLPATNASPVREAQQRPVEHRGNGTVVVMDDEETIRETMSAMLSSCGYDAVCHANGTEALEYVRAAIAAKRTLAGAIVDLTVPGGMGGEQFAVEVRQFAPGLPVFVSSGYAEDPIMKDPQAYGFTASLCKPFRKRELAQMLNDYAAKKTEV